MHVPPFTPDEVRIVSRYDVYFRWHTRWRKSVAIDRAVMAAWKDQITSKYRFPVLKLDHDHNEFIIVLGLQSGDSVSTAASKVKGLLSKISGATLGKGYFACTLGENTREDVRKYLDRQESHHHYDKRLRSPAWQKSWPHAEAPQPGHAVARLSFHVVFGTWRRQGFFTTRESPMVAERWMEIQESERFAIKKASFLPDHVHLAIDMHPSVKPGELLLRLMNAAQEVVLKLFPNELIRYGLNRLWQPEAYLGGYGDINSSAMKKYLVGWKSRKSAA